MQNEITTLIVEDDPMVLEINKQFVEKVEGFTVVGSAQSGKKALELLKLQKPQLVILDIYLPDLSGIEILKEIRAMGYPADVIMITAARDAETIKEVLRYGAIDYIVKPFKFSRMQNALLSYRMLRTKLEEKNVLDQEEIDVLKKTKAPIKPFEELPKGLNEVTLRQIFLYLVKKKDSLSAEEVAAGVGVARVTARRYLEYLAKIGKLQLKIQYGSVGRPIKRYYIA